MHKPTPIMMSPTKNKNSKLPNFSFLIETTTLSASVVRLNSSPAQLASNLWPSTNKYGHGYLLPDLIFHQNLGFRAIISNPELLKKTMKGSNNLNYSLLSNKTMNQKIWSVIWRSGPDDLRKNVWTYPIMTSPTKKTKPELLYELQDFPHL